VSQQQHAGVGGARLEPAKLLACLARGGDVAARILDRAVSHRDPGLRASDERQRRELLADVVGEHPRGPLEGLPCERPDSRVVEPPDRDEVVVAGDAEGVEVPDAPSALVRGGAVPHEVSEAQVAVHSRPLEDADRRHERGKVPVDVGEDSVAHQRRLAPVDAEGLPPAVTPSTVAPGRPARCAAFRQRADLMRGWETISSSMLKNDEVEEPHASSPPDHRGGAGSGASGHAISGRRLSRPGAASASKLIEATPVAVDVHLRSGVAGLRALGEAGLDPVALGRTWGDAGLWSRHAADRAVVAGRSQSPRCFTDALGRLVGDVGPVVPYPGMERTIDLILAAANTRPDVVAPFPAGATCVLRKKSNLAPLADDAGIAVPRTWIVGTPAELRRARIGFPCAVKSDDPVGSLSGTRIVEGREAVHRLLDRVPQDGPLIVQERIEGPLVCLAVVVDREGAVVSRFQHVAHTTWPAEAGPTARAVSVVPDRDLVARAGQLVRAAGYWGLVQLDFLPGSDGHAIIDANPRYYPALALATKCGVNLPGAWHQVVLGAPTTTPVPYRVGMSYRWVEADVMAALRGRPGRLLYRGGESTTGAMWDTEDPVPAALLAAVAVASRPVKRVSRLVSATRRVGRRGR